LEWAKVFLKLAHQCALAPLELVELRQCVVVVWMCVKVKREFNKDKVDRLKLLHK
jgi:hypothetical protein